MSRLRPTAQDLPYPVPRTRGDEPLSSAAIARRVGVSVRTREALFRRALGVGPGTYGVQLRLQAARKMVTDTDLPLGEVAMRTGFASPSSIAQSSAVTPDARPATCGG